MDWNKFLKSLAVTFAVTVGKTIVIELYTANKDIINRRIEEIIKTDPFAIEIDRKDGYL